MCGHLSHLVVPWGRLGDDVGESAEVWREVEIEDITMEGFVQESYFLGVPMSLLALPGPCHLFFGARRYPQENAKLHGRETSTAKTEARVACARFR
jgi:hypothetical protein